MTTATFRQYDARWGSKNYNGSSTMAAAGCGPTSCADLIYNINTKVDPWEAAKYMKSHGYAIRNNGTAHDGIPACLKAFGMSNVKYQSNMSGIYTAMQENNGKAVFLFRGGSRGGVCWTTGGHYLAVSDFKVDAGKHLFYMHDPGQRKHDGWYCYENTMKGLVYKAWTCNFKDGEKKEPSEKISVDGNWGTATTLLTQKVLGCSQDGQLGKNTWKAIQKKCGLSKSDQDGKPGPKTYSAMSKFLGINEQTSKTKTLVKAWQTWLNSQVK